MSESPDCPSVRPFYFTQTDRLYAVILRRSRGACPELLEGIRPQRKTMVLRHGPDSSLHRVSLRMTSFAIFSSALYSRSHCRQKRSVLSILAKMVTVAIAQVKRRMQDMSETCRENPVCSDRRFYRAMVAGGFLSGVDDLLRHRAE